jgi:translation initiation factor 1
MRILDRSGRVMATNERIVYSTGIGRRCPNCLRPCPECVCRRGTPAKAPSDGIVRVGRETRGRKGKSVSIISGLGLPRAQLDALAAQLKKRCGSGGSIEDDRILIQGDHRDALVAELKDRGWTVKRAGA